MGVLAIFVAGGVGAIGFLLIGTFLAIVGKPINDSEDRAIGRSGLNYLGIGSACIGIAVIILQLSALLSLPR